jgi:hypothetical protein
VYAVNEAYPTGTLIPCPCSATTLITVDIHASGTVQEDSCRVLATDKHLGRCHALG